MSDCPVCYGMEGYTLHTCGRVSEADILEQEQHDNDTGYCCPHCGSPTPNTELKARIEALEDAMSAILGEEAGFDETESLAKIFILARQALLEAK